MTDISKPDTPATREDRGVLCGKCDHLNPPGSTDCEFCHRSLFHECVHCGEPIQRGLHRCPHCHGRQKKRASKHRRYLRKLTGGAFGVTWWQVLFLLVAVYITYKIVLRMSQ